MEERFVIKRKEFKKLERYAENIYNAILYYIKNKINYQLDFHSLLSDVCHNLKGGCVWKKDL